MSILGLYNNFIILMKWRVLMNLKAYINDQGMTLDQIGEICDISPHTMSKYKRSIRIPRKAHMIKIYEGTNKQVTPNDFYGLGTDQ